MSPPLPSTAPDLQSCADDVRRGADAIRHALVPISPCSRDDVWTGGKARRFRDALDDENRRLAGVADQLDLVARRLDLRAAEAALGGTDGGVNGDGDRAIVSLSVRRAVGLLATAAHP